MSNFYDYYTENKDKLHLHIINIDDVDILVREITWKEGLLIDAKSFRKKDDIVYQNSEFEKREILKLCLLRAYDKSTSEEYISSYLEPLIDRIDHITIEKVWVGYQQHLYLNADEANFYYLASKKYFDPNSSETYPVPPVVVEIDYMTRGLVSLNKNEFDSLTMKEFETIQLILAIKNEVKKEGIADLNIDLDREL
jgi:hypothetical protein